MKRLALLLLLACLSLQAKAREITPFTADMLRDGSDLIAIAQPISVKETSERAPLPQIHRTDKNGKDTPLIGAGLETEFEVLTVLKGNPTLKHFVLHHYRETGRVNGELGPGLVSFDIKQKNSFILFLKKTADGRYEAVSGQTDPNMSIRTIVGPFFVLPSNRGSQ